MILHHKYQYTTEHILYKTVDIICDGVTIDHAIVILGFFTFHLSIK